MGDELFHLPQQGVPGCGIRMHGLHLRSSKGSGLVFADELAGTCFTDAGKPLDSHPTVEIRCFWKVIARFTVAAGRWDVLVESKG